MAQLKGNILAIKFNQKEWTQVEENLKVLIMQATPQVSLSVAKRVYNDINNSGNVPLDTGKLKNDTSVFQDRFNINYATMGWFQPYAKKLYYGIYGEKVWKTTNGKRKSFISSSTGNGIPFWDTPFTRDPVYMIRVYQWAFRKQKFIS